MSEFPPSAPPVPEPEWTIAAARTLYNIDRWGAGYFDIQPQGNVVARPLQNGVEVNISDVVEEAKARGLKLPPVDPLSGHSPTSCDRSE